MNVAIYSRKSKITEKGDSIDNQIQLCQTYIKQNFTNIKEILIYSDEGFSGGDTNRPMFKKMMGDLKSNKFKILICYQLDRISRNVAHFANIYETLEQYNVEFISIKEQFDTSTPIGRAMLNIAIVFAQLERETIAERIKDNMHTLATSGRWLGGNCPTGFKSIPIQYYDSNGVQKQEFKLSPIQEQVDVVQLIFKKFLELKSLRQLESYLMNCNIKTKNNCNFSAATIRDILINPVYCKADKDIYDFFHNVDASIYGTIDHYNGSCGIMAYNRTRQSENKSKRNPMSKWIISIGKHQGLITGMEWIQVQKTLNNNSQKSFYTSSKANYGILSGIIKCGQCGGTMRIKKDKISKKTGKQLFYYVCSKKELSKRTLCNSRNIRGQTIDIEIMNHINTLAHNLCSGPIQFREDDLSIHNNFYLSQGPIKNIQRQIQLNNTYIQNLIGYIAKIPLSNKSVLEHFIIKMESLNKKNLALEKQLEKEAKSTQTLFPLYDFNKILFLNDDIFTQRYIIRCLIKNIIWHEDRIDINFFPTLCRGSISNSHIIPF